MNLKAQRAAAIKAAQDIIAKAQAEDRALNDEERTEIEAKEAEIKSLTDQIEAAEQSDAIFGRIAALGKGAPDEGADDDKRPAKSLGEHFAKSASRDQLARLKTTPGSAVSVPEFKAAGDTHTVGEVFGPVLTEIDRTVVREFRRPVLSDLLGQGTLGAGSNAVTYFVEGAIEGGFGMVAEGGQKPQFHIADPTTRTDALKKIAGVLSFTDEMVEDLDFWVSEINQRGLYMLALAEENQLLNGSGTGQNVLGLLNRSGIQTETSTGPTDNADALFRAITKVQTATGLSADGIVMNPADYQQLRLAKDSNGQYMGGGFFYGQYGNGGVVEQPPLWGQRTIVSAGIPAGTAAVGAFKTATTVYRKGGVRVESTNSHADDFDYNRIRTRIEERVALAVRIPSAVVKVTLAGADGE